METLAITVTDGSPASLTHLSALLESLGRQATDVDLVVVLRGGGEPPASPSPRVRVHGAPAPMRIASSAARNVGLDHAQAAGLLAAADLVAFPDDDCRYPDGLLPRVAGHVASGADVVCGAFAPAREAIDRRRFPARSLPLTPGLVMQVVSANNVLFAGDAARALGRFDERLGLGGRWDGGEDVDLVLRALDRGLRGVYEPDDAFVEHPYKAHRRGQYYVAAVAVLAKHAFGPRPTAVLLARRIALGGVLVARGALPARDLRRALGVVVPLARASWTGRRAT